MINTNGKPPHRQSSRAELNSEHVPIQICVKS